MFKCFGLVACITLAGASYAQDVIVTKEAEKISAKVIEVSDDNIRYKKSSNPDGPTYSMRLSRVSYIRYANGSMDWFSATNQSGEEEDVTDETSFDRPKRQVKDDDNYPVAERRTTSRRYDNPDNRTVRTSSDRQRRQIEDYDDEDEYPETERQTMRNNGRTKSRRSSGIPTRKGSFDIVPTFGYDNNSILHRYVLGVEGKYFVLNKLCVAPSFYCFLPGNAYYGIIGTPSYGMLATTTRTIDNAWTLMLNINVHYLINIGRFIEIYPVVGIGGRGLVYNNILEVKDGKGERLKLVTTKGKILSNYMSYLGGGLTFHLTQLAALYVIKSCK
jgi:hypothetical protein